MICPAGHTEAHFEETGIAKSIRKIMLLDRLLGVGVKQAKMVILDGRVNNGKIARRKNLEQAHRLGRKF